MCCLVQRFPVLDTGGGPVPRPVSTNVVASNLSFGLTLKVGATSALFASVLPFVVAVGWLLVENQTPVVLAVGAAPLFVLAVASPYICFGSLFCTIHLF